jgi:hypothetical protein
MRIELTDEQLIANTLAKLERNELKAMKVNRGKFVRTFKGGSKAEILQMMDENFSWDKDNDLNKFKVGQIVEVFREYVDGFCLIVGDSFVYIDSITKKQVNLNYELYIPTNFLKSINN